MPRKKLTDAGVRNAKAPAHGRVELFDSLTPGMSLRITEKNHRSWTLLLRIGPKGARRLRRMTLGDARMLSLPEARARARGILTEAAAGRDPTQAKSEDHSFGGVIAEWLECAVKPNCRSRTYTEYKRVLDHDCSGWRDRPLDSIRRVDIIELVQAVAARGARAQANKLLARMRTFFAWAVANNFVESSPVSALRKPAKENARSRRLTDPEIVLLWKACEQLAYPMGPVTQLLLLTGQRRQEVAGMTWDEVDLTAGIWRIPAARTKSSREHIVHLSQPSIDIIKALPKVSAKWLFTTNGRGPVAGFSRAKRMLDKTMERERRIALKLPKDAEPAIESWTLHDLRRTFASGCAQIGIEAHVADRVLNHSSRALGVVASIYNQHEYLEQRKVAMERWADHVLGLVRPPASNVVQLRSK